MRVWTIALRRVTNSAMIRWPGPEWIKVSKADGRDSRVSTASGERRSMSRRATEDEGARKYSRDLCDNRDLRDESDESLAETEVYVSDENRWRKASEVFPDHPGQREDQHGKCHD
eukprot:s152_g6.t1